MTIWVVEKRSDKKSKWEFLEAFTTRADALNYGWEPVDPAEFRLVKYKRVRKD